MTYASDFKELIPLLTRKEGGEAEDLDEAAPTSLEAQVEANALAQSLALGSDLGGDTRRSGEHYVGYNPLNPEEDWHVQRQKEKEDAIKAALDRMNWSNLVNLKAGGGAVADFKELIPLLTRNGGGDMSTIQKKINIGGEPHQLSYINSDEANLLGQLGGSGQPVNGVPAYAYGDPEADDPTEEGPGEQHSMEDAAISKEAARDVDIDRFSFSHFAGLAPDPDLEFEGLPNWLVDWQNEPPNIGEWRERDPILPRRSRKEGGGLSEIYRARGGSLPSDLCYNRHGKIVKCTSINRPNLEPDKPPTYDPLGIEGFLTSWDKDPMWEAALAGVSGAIPGGALFTGLATQHMRQNYVNEIRAQYGLKPLGMFDIGETFEEQSLGKMTPEEVMASGGGTHLAGPGGFSAVGRNPFTDPTVMHPHDYNPKKRAWQEFRDAHVQKARRDARVATKAEEEEVLQYLPGLPQKALGFHPTHVTRADPWEGIGIGRVNYAIDQAKQAEQDWAGEFSDAWDGPDTDDDEGYPGDEYKKGGRIF